MLLYSLCAQDHYPIFFGHELMQVGVSDVPMTINSDIPVDAWTHLAYAVVIPKHLQVYDRSIMLAHVDPQMTSQQMTDALGKVSDQPSPLPRKLGLAVEAYIAACATHSSMMKFVGFVICLETLCEQESRLANEIAALKAIKVVLRKSEIAEIGAVHENMVQATFSSIGMIQLYSIGVQLSKLIAVHAASIATHLDHGRPWGSNIKKGAQLIYSMRSKIVHEGCWGAEHETIWAAQGFVRAAAKAVLLDKVNLPSSKIE